MVASDEIRRALCAGSGIGEPNPAANSRAEGRAEKPTPGAAMGDVLMMPLEGGGQVRFTAVHGRVEMQMQVGKQRSWLTTPMSIDRAHSYAIRLLEIAEHARAQRQAKGA